MASTSKDVQAIERALNIKNIPWCEEYEAMISSMPYRSWESTELAKARARAASLVNKYNQLDASEEVLLENRSQECSRISTLQSLLGSFDEASSIEAPFSVLYGCNTIIGKNFFGNTGLAIDDSAFVTIGDDVLIGPNVQFITINHPTEVASRLQGIMYAKPITVGNACWIGARVTILPGATIGNGCTIGAGAVVSGSIPEYSVAVGVPARVVKQVTRLDQTQDGASEAK